MARRATPTVSDRDGGWWSAREIGARLTPRICFHLPGQKYRVPFRRKWTSRFRKRTPVGFAELADALAGDDYKEAAETQTRANLGAYAACECAPASGAERSVETGSPFIQPAAGRDWHLT